MYSNWTPKAAPQPAPALLTLAEEADALRRTVERLVQDKDRLLDERRALRPLV
jgi:hypothetical protein